MAEQEINFKGLLAPFAEATASELDAKYTEGCFRDEFIFPTKGQLHSKTLAEGN
jgi:hypothetical protein